MNPRNPETNKNNIDILAFRKKYPQYNNWSDERLSNAIDLKHQKEGVSESEKGWAGVGNDIQESFGNLPEAASNFISSIPQGTKNVGQYSFSHNPLETMGNLGAGGVESLAGLLSGPQSASRYIGEKFPAFGEWMKKNRASDDSRTLYEQLIDFEKEKGLASRSKQESSVRNLGGLLFGGKVLSELKNPLAGTLAISGEAAGRGGDPLHAAILGSAGHLIAKAPWKEAAKPSNVANAIKNIPEMAGQGAASVLGTAADIGSKFHIPGIQPTLGALSSYLKHKSVSPEKFAARKLFGDIKEEDLPLIEERVNAAKRLGLNYITPAEATLSPFEAAKQGTIGRTSSGSKLLFEKGKGRTSSEGTAINNLLDTIYDAKELDPKKSSAYEETMKGQVTDDFIQRQTQRHVIQKAIKTLENDAAYKQKIEEELGVKLGDIKPNSFMYWDMVKRVLGDMGESAKEQGKPTTKSDIIAETRRSMVKEMDNIKPEYETARGISERKFTRRKLEDIFDKKTMTGNNFYKFLQSKKNFNDVMNKLKAFPEAQQKLKDMHLLFGDLIPNDISIRTAAQQKRTGMSESRNKLDALKQDLDEKYGQEHDVATVNMMTDPALLDLIKRHLKDSGYKGSQNIFGK